MPKSNAHIVLNIRDRTGGQYNSALFNAQNQNIIQGDIKNITVSEVNFPYDIPNIQAGFNFFAMLNVGPPNYALVVTVPPGFYKGDELAAAINVASTAAGAANAPAILPADIPQCTYSDVSNRFTFTSPPAPTAPRYSTWNFTSPSTFPSRQDLVSQLYKDILSIMGFYTEQEPNVSFVNTIFVSGSAPMTFTQYVDICSPQLCKFQYFRDGSTTNLSRRSDVICRLYISNNIALLQGDPEGVRPFVINRQFYNARRMRWTADNSVGTIDINLYDDVGQPLTTTWQPRPYQITFNAMENAVDEGLRGGEMLSANVR